LDIRAGEYTVEIRERIGGVINIFGS